MNRQIRNQTIDETKQAFKQLYHEVKPHVKPTLKIMTKSYKSLTKQEKEVYLSTITGGILLLVALRIILSLFGY